MRFMLGLMLCLWQLCAAAADERPNILWIVSEDHGPHMGCYGDNYAITPNVDKLAAKGMIYTHAWSNAPVCAPARTTIISGMYPKSTGGEGMRSLVDFPAGKKMFPQYLREAGYYCTNNAKEDYNFKKPEEPWSETSKKAHWKNRAAGQPFFAVFNSEKSHESQIRIRPHTFIHDPTKAPIPSYHPDTKEVREDWAQYYDCVSEADADAGKRLQELDEAGLADSTIVFYYGDHGSGMPRSKRWPYNSGLQVPLVVYIPEKFKHLAPPDYKPGGKSDRLVSFVDLAPTILSLAGIKPPDWMQGHAFLGKFIAEPQPYLYGYRARMDERFDLVRSITDGRYVYIRNFRPDLIYGQHIDYMFQTPTTRVWKQMYDAGKLNAAQKIFWEKKPPEEFYDLQTDPDEVKNLAADPAQQATLEKFRAALHDHTLKIRDVGLLPEAEQFARAGNGSIYDMAQDPAKYPVERVLAMAELASSLKADALPQLQAALKDPDSGVRYWAALGILMRGGGGEALLSDLRTAQNDSCPSFAIIAAQILATYGRPDDVTAALATLKSLADPKQNPVFVSTQALNVIDALGEKAASLLPALKEFHAPPASDRNGQYISRLLSDLLHEKPAKK